MQSSGGHLLLGHEAGQLGSLEIETYTLRQQGSVKGITWHISREGCSINMLRSPYVEPVVLVTVEVVLSIWWLSRALRL